MPRGYGRYVWLRTVLFVGMHAVLAGGAAILSVHFWLLAGCPVVWARVPAYAHNA